MVVAVVFLQGAFYLPVFFLTFTVAISSVTLTSEESRRRLTESVDMHGVKDIVYINITLVFSLMHHFLTDTDIESVVADINISQKIQKCSNSAKTLMSKCPRLDTRPDMRNILSTCQAFNEQ